MVNSSEAVDVDVVVDEHESRLEVKNIPTRRESRPAFPEYSHDLLNPTRSVSQAVFGFWVRQASSKRIAKYC